MMISPLMSGQYRFVEDGDALCLRHEVRAAALRHPADEASDALPCCAVIPGWKRVGLGARLRNRNAYQEHAGNKSEKSAAPTHR
jgi:hypothetical protein